MTPQKNDPLILRKSQNQKSFHLKREIQPNDGGVIGEKSNNDTNYIGNKRRKVHLLFI